MSISRGYSGDIFTLLDSIDSEDEEDLENMMNGSDTEFVAEDRSVISTNIIRKEEIGDQSSSKKNESIICLPKTRMKPIL